jgi:hypothetical protein
MGGLADIAGIFRKVDVPRVVGFEAWKRTQCRKLICIKSAR